VFWRAELLNRGNEVEIRQATDHKCPRKHSSEFRPRSTNALSNKFRLGSRTVPRELRRMPVDQPMALREPRKHVPEQQASELSTLPHAVGHLVAALTPTMLHAA